MVDQYARARARMVQECLVDQGIRDRRVLEAMRKVPRHLFVPSGLAAACHQDAALPIDGGQSISQPLIVALMTEHLQIEKWHSVLEIGTGSGYQTAILAELAQEVFTVERLAALQDQARRVLNQLRYRNIHYRVADGARGWPEPRRFHRILVTAAGREIPHELAAQLSEGGRLIMPLASDGRQLLALAIKVNGRLRRRTLGDCNFLPLVTGLSCPLGRWDRSR